MKNLYGGAALALVVGGLNFGTGTALAQDRTTVVLHNHGGAMEGHTPRGFRGMGTGLFTGDNLNPRFPNGDGVQIFLTFDLSGLPEGRVETAILRAGGAQIQGTPFRDLGALRGEEIRYDRFSPDLWNKASRGANCLFADSRAGPYACELTGAVQRSRDDGYRYAQFRLRLDKAGDGDGRADLVMFFKTSSNTNEPGIFELAVTLRPERQSRPATQDREDPM